MLTKKYISPQLILLSPSHMLLSYQLVMDCLDCIMLIGVEAVRFCNKFAGSSFAILIRFEWGGFVMDLVF